MLILGLALGGAAHAALKFGKSESIRFVANVPLEGPKGEKLFLGRMVAMDSFLLPYTVRDEGYVLGVSGESRRYFRMPEGEQLAALQRAGRLPDPLPTFALTRLDLAFGHALWIFLGAMGLWAAYAWLRPARRNPAGLPASTPPAPPAWDGPEIVLPMRLVPGRGKLFVLLLVCSGFVATGLWLADKEPLMGYLTAGFFALGIPVFVLNMLPGVAYLVLDREGFTFASLFRKHTVRWADVAAFCIWRAGGNRMVGWQYAPDYKPQAAGRAFARALTGVQGGLPDTYGMKAEKLAALMNELKRRSTG